VSPQQRAPSGERFQRARGGLGGGLGRSGGTCVLVVARGARSAFSPLCHTVERLFTSWGDSGSCTVEQLSWLPRRNAGDIAVEALGDLPVLLSLAMQV
jgi:hypothetical protein